jgi:hypothetical protein
VLRSAWKKGGLDSREQEQLWKQGYDDALEFVSAIVLNSGYRNNLKVKKMLFTSRETLIR